MTDIMKEPMDSSENSLEPLNLSSTESQILSLYDQLKELLLEVSLVQAQSSSQYMELDSVTPDDISTARTALLDAKAHYDLRNSIIDSLLITTPVLNAVHAGERANPIERDLLPLLSHRDTVSLSLASASSTLSKTQVSLTAACKDHISSSETNKQLASRMLAAAAETRTQGIDDVQNENTREEIRGLQEGCRASRQRYRIMKAVMGAVVVGSGVDWTRDPGLRELVLEGDED